MPYDNSVSGELLAMLDNLKELNRLAVYYHSEMISSMKRVEELNKEALRITANAAEHKAKMLKYVGEMKVARQDMFEELQELIEKDEEKTVTNVIDLNQGTIELGRSA